MSKLSMLEEKISALENHDCHLSPEDSCSTCELLFQRSSLKECFCGQLTLNTNFCDKWDKILDDNNL